MSYPSASLRTGTKRSRSGPVWMLGASLKTAEAAQPPWARLYALIRKTGLGLGFREFPTMEGSF